MPPAFPPSPPSKGKLPPPAPVLLEDPSAPAPDETPLESSNRRDSLAEHATRSEAPVPSTATARAMRIDKLMTSSTPRKQGTTKQTRRAGRRHAPVPRGPSNVALFPASSTLHAK